MNAESIKIKPRNSRIEIFRIVVTLLVLVVHFNGYFVDLDVHEFNFYNSGQIIIEALSCIAVNGFIIISGFYGVRFGLRTIWKIYIVLVSIYFPIFVIHSIYHSSFDFHYLLKSIFPISTGENYYINGYVQLVMFSPLLNYFTKRVGSNVWVYSVILLLAEFYFDCICGLETFGYKEGYSGLHFITLYMVGRALNENQNKLYYFKRPVYLFLYLASSLIIVMMTFLRIPWTFSYTNPIMIVSASALFAYFVTGKPFFNASINRIAGCCLTAYILQISLLFEPVLIRIDKYLLANYCYSMYLLLALLIIIAFYIVAFVWDRLRILSCSGLSIKVEDCLSRIDKRINVFDL